MSLADVNERQRMIDGLRDLAAVIESHPESDARIYGAFVHERVGGWEELCVRCNELGGDWLADDRDYTARRVRKFGPFRWIVTCPLQPRVVGKDAA